MLIRNKREYIFLFIFLAFLSTKALKSLGESEGCFAKTPRQWRSCNLLFIWRRFASHPVNVHDSATQHWTKPHPFWMASETAKMNIYITIAVPTLRLAYKRGANMMIQYDSFAYLFFSFSSFFFFCVSKNLTDFCSFSSVSFVSMVARQIISTGFHRTWLHSGKNTAALSASTQCCRFF